MVEGPKFEPDSINLNYRLPNANVDNGSKKLEEIKRKLIDSIRGGNIVPAGDSDQNRLLAAIKHQAPVTYQQKIDKQETDIRNIIERGKEPLKHPKTNPEFTTTGPNGGKLEQFPQRANGTYVTIETLPNGETFECTYSESGNKLNEIKRNSLSTTITTYNGNTTDRVTISQLHGQETVGKIQAGIPSQKPPTLQEIRGRELDGFRTK